MRSLNNQTYPHINSNCPYIVKLPLNCQIDQKHHIIHKLSNDFNIGKLSHLYQIISNYSRITKTIENAKIVKISKLPQNF